MTKQKEATPEAQSSTANKRSVKSLGRKIITYLSLIIVAGVLLVTTGVIVALATVYPRVPDVAELTKYKPSMPLRIFAADGTLLGEFGLERRRFTSLDKFPEVLKQAVLSAEDARFYRHSGFDFKGILRAALTVLTGGKKQGASTITMQVARNLYLSSERTAARKIYEAALTIKLEKTLSKDKIFEIYLNHIFLGQRSYGFAAAAETYFAKKVMDLDIAEAAVLATLPKSPSDGNPFRNFDKAKKRQEYVINRMLANGFITAEQAQQAKEEELVLNKKVKRDLTKGKSSKKSVQAEYVTEMVRSALYEEFGEDTYTRGFNVYTTINVKDQQAAYSALRRGLMAYELRQVYRGPQGFVALPSDPEERNETITKALKSYTDEDPLYTAVVLEVSPSKVVVQGSNHEIINIEGKNLFPVQSGLQANAPSEIKIVPGSIVTLMQHPNESWTLTQKPDVEGSIVAVDNKTGAILALVGGFDFLTNQYNHATQAWRQTGSVIKPFIYSAALEKGVSPATIINDSPVSFGSWRPKNYGGSFAGPVTARSALLKSRNIPTIKVAAQITPAFARQWLSRFGFDKEKHPPYLTLALGAGEATPLQMAMGYATFANGGYLLAPFLITKITDSNDKLLKSYQPQKLTEATRVIPARNAFIMNNMLEDVATYGTAARTRATLKRADLAGKTGTTNRSRDAWFLGYQPAITAAVWVGYDTPKQLGARETGASAAMPIWIDFMAQALKSVPLAAKNKAPAGLQFVNGDWYYSEYTGANGIHSIGMEYEYDRNVITPQEREYILKLFQAQE